MERETTIKIEKMAIIAVVCRNSMVYFHDGLGVNAKHEIYGMNGIV